MDSFLLGHAVQKNGPDLIRHLQLEQQQFPDNVIHYLTKYKPKPPEVQDQELKEKICRFISKKADFLFSSPPEKEDKERRLPDNEDTFAKMPPLETFMGVPEVECRRNFFCSVEKHDIVIGVVSSVLESGLVITLLCLDNGKSRDIDELRISAFCPVKELPKLFPNQDAIEGFQVRDKVRAVVLNVNPETEKLIVSMVERSLPEDMSHIKLALINEDEFPVQYRRKLHIRGLTFDELLHSILGFNNSGNITCLLEFLDQTDNCSLMRGLNMLKIPEKDMAENLRKFQSQKMAHSSVAQGITYFKAGKQPEAIQCFNKALDIDKTNVEAFVARGALYANNESFNRAIDDFEDALKINPSHVNARKYLHDTLLAYGKSNEDIEKYQEAEELYSKAMALNQASVEAREALRFLHYKRSQRSHKESRRKSSPRKERSLSPQGFEQTAKTLKKLIKGEDKRHRKKRRRMSRESSSSSSRSASSERRRRDDSSDRRRKRRSRSRDHSQRNLSPPADHPNRQAVYGEPEVLPHQQYGVDLQASFLSGAGASFSDIFRSSSQESDAGQVQSQAQPIPPVSLQYGTNPYLFGNPPANWYGIPGAGPSPLYGYNNQYVGQGQIYPDHQEMFYQGNQMAAEAQGYRSGRRRSKSGRSRSPSFDRRRRKGSRSPSYEQNQNARKKSPSTGKKQYYLGESRSPKYERNQDRARSRSTSFSRGQGQNAGNRRNQRRMSRSPFQGGESPESRSRYGIAVSPGRGHQVTSNRKESLGKEDYNPPTDRSKSWSRSPDNFEEYRTVTAQIVSTEKSPKNSRWSRSLSPRNYENLESSPEGLYRDEPIRKSQDNSNEQTELDDNNMQQITLQKMEEDIVEDVKIKSGKKKKGGDNKVKTKKKRKESGEVKKKSKKKLEGSKQLDSVKKEFENTGGQSETDRLSVASSSTGKKKSQKVLAPSEINVEGTNGNQNTGDIRRVVPKDSEDIQAFNKVVGQKDKSVEEKLATKKTKEKDIVNEFLRSKWDSPDEMRSSPLLRPARREPYGESGRGDMSADYRNKRSNSREFEGIRIHITNDKFGKAAEQKEDLGVVEMFHVNEQPRKLTKKSAENISKENDSLSMQSNETSRRQSDVMENERKSIKKIEKQEQSTDKMKIYRKRTKSSSKSRSLSFSKSRSRSHHSKSPHQRSHSRSHKRRSSGSQNRKKSRSHSRRSWSRTRRRSRSRSRKRSYGRKPWSPPHRKPSKGFKSRPVIMGRNKFTDSRSPSLSPGRKYSGKLNSRRSPNWQKTRGGRGRGTYRGNNRGRGRANSSFRDHHRSHRSRSRSHSRKRSRSKSPSNRERGYKKGHGRKSDGDKSGDVKFDNRKLDELEDFYKRLKENKKKQTEAK